MTREEAEEYAKEMTYRDAINNLMKARSIPYRKATFIKVNELLKALEQEPKTGHWEWQTEDIYQCSECGEDIHVKEVMNKPQYICCPICGCPMEIER